MMFAKPISPKATSAAAVVGIPPSRSSGPPVPATAIPKVVASRLAREPERDEPADDPADADGRVEVADAAGAQIEQLERRDSDQDAEGAVDERLRGEEPDDETQPRVVPIARKPAVASSARCGRSRLSGGSVARSSGETISAEKRKSRAVKTKTTQTPESESSSPPTAGNAKPTLSTALVVTFAAVSSSGDLASDGSSAACAGRNAVPIAATVAART